MARNSARAWWGAAAALGMPAGMSTLMEATKPNGKAPEAEVVLRDPGQAAPPAASAAAGPLPDHARSSVLFGEAAGKPQKSSGGTGGVPGRGGAPSSDESKCCLGALYFSQALHDRKKGPVCLGVRSTPDAIEEDMKNPATGLADFKYLCVGYALYTKPPADGKEGSKPNPLTDDIVQLPYCEGLEVVSSRDMQNSPVLLKEGLDDGPMAGPKPGARGESNAPADRDGAFGKNFVRPPGEVNLQDFPTRFLNVAKKILNKMKSNIQYMCRYVYNFYAKLFDGGNKPKGD